MADNNWGKQPPKKQAYTPPTLNTPSFWGPAPVPPKVYATWASIRGEGRDGSEYEAPEGIDEGGAHDSWVSKFSKRFAIDPVNIQGEGRDGSSTDTDGGDDGDGGSFATGGTDTSIETSTIEGEGRDGSSPSTEGGDDGDSVPFGTGEGATEGGESSVEGEGREGSSPETEGRNSVANSVNISGNTRPDSESDSPESLTAGSHDSWVTGFEKELASSTSGSVDPTVREQGAGGHDSWVSKFSQQIATEPFSVSGSGEDGSYVASPVKKPPIVPPSAIFGKTRSGTSYETPEGLPEDSAHDSWVTAFKKELVKGEGKSWVTGPPSNATTPIPRFGVTSTTPPSAKSPSDKFVGQWNFRVKVNGIPDDNCKLLSISGLSSETEPIEFKRSTRQYVESIPGKYKYSNVELTKVMNMGGDSFAAWREQIEAGMNAFRTITVYLHHIDLKGAPVMTLTLHDAWPVKWEFPELSGSSSDAAIEKITLDVARITRG